MQALTTLNDPAFFEAAQAMAARIIREGGSDVASRAEYGFRLAVARKPKAGELSKLVAAFERERAYFEARPDESRKLTANRDLAEGHTAELAAWTMLSNALLNLDETLTKE